LEKKCFLIGPLFFKASVLKDSSFNEATSAIQDFFYHSFVASRTELL
jgi:hypothetical protein